MGFDDLVSLAQLRMIWSLETQLGRIPKNNEGITKRIAKTLIDGLLEELEYVNKTASVQ